MSHFRPIEVPIEVQRAAHKLSETPADQRTDRQRGWNKNLSDAGLEKTLQRIAGRIESASYDGVEPQIEPALLDSFMEAVSFHLAFRVYVFAVVVFDCFCDCHYPEANLERCGSQQSKHPACCEDGIYLERALVLNSKEAIMHAASYVEDPRTRKVTLVAYEPSHS